MIDPTAKLSVSRQAIVLGISRGSVYYKPRPVSDADLKLMHRIDKLHMEFPFAGSRMLQGLLVQEGFRVGRLHVATLMKRMGIEALYRRPNTSKPAPGHKIYPYLLRKLPITRPNQVWAMDITYIPMARGFIYLAAVLDWFTRRVLAWRVSITLEADFCIEAVEEALARHGTPGIFNTDSQPIHVDRLHQGAGRPRDQDQHGWQGRVAGQCLRRALVADHQIRRGLPEGLCQRVRSPGRDRPLSDLLQWPPPAFFA